jgi:lysophospholipase L1-like esterase
MDDTPRTPDPPPKIILFGDSLTEWGFDEDDAGFGWALQDYYSGKVDVLNEGMLREQIHAR